LIQGAILPWPEIYVSGKRMSEKEIAKRKKKDPDFSGRVLTPKILGGGEMLLTQYTDPREPLMDWLRARENPYFARAFVNRVWAVYFGRGIVEPADDMNLANPPSNKELIEHLAGGFVKSGYDMKWLHREIANSDTYQRSWKPTPSNRQDEKNFSHAVIRRLPAEVVFDSIALAVAASSEQAKFASDLESRAIGPNASITGRSGRRPLCADDVWEAFAQHELRLRAHGGSDAAANDLCAQRSGATRSARWKGRRWGMDWRIAPRGRISNGAVKADLAKLKTEKQNLARKRAEREAEPPLDEELVRKLESRIKEIDERIERTRALLVETEAAKPLNFEQLIEEVFLRTVSRPPTGDEIARAKQDIGRAGQPVDGLRELLWAMLNTREFMVNH
jgi:hypothetical protein